MSDITDFIGGQIPIWVSGGTVVQWRYVISPIDGEVYQRTAATGSGTTDPANDTTNYVAASYVRVSALSSKNAIDNLSNAPAQFANNSVKVSIASITEGVRTQVLSLSGRGSMAFLAIMKAATGGGTVEIIVDGITIYNSATSTATTTEAHCLIGAPGSADPGVGSVRPFAVALPDAMPVIFRRTFVVWYTPTTNASGANATLAYDLRSTR